jgi:hypothetical protein
MGVGSKKDDGKEVQLAFRVPAELLEAIDAEVEKLRGKQPGMKINRSDVVRQILYKALVRK